jgi:hypothetical protein
MKKENKLSTVDYLFGTIIGFVVTGTVVLMISMVISTLYKNFKAPDYQKGDCVAFFTDANEFEDSEMLMAYVVAAVGDENYLLFRPSYSGIAQEVKSIRTVDRLYDAIDCETLEKL